MTKPWWWGRDDIREAIERTKRALIDNVLLANNVPFTETTLERACHDVMRVRCERCFTLKGPNKHSAVLFAEGKRLCMCCWFDMAFAPPFGFVLDDTVSRSLRRQKCAGALYAADYVRSDEFERDVMRDRLQQVLGE